MVDDNIPNMKNILNPESTTNSCKMNIQTTCVLIF
jgi:hypothetical protein